MDIIETHTMKIKRHDPEIIRRDIAISELRAELAASIEREQTLRDALVLLRCPEWAERVQDEHAAEFDAFVSGVLRRARPTGEA